MTQTYPCPRLLPLLLQGTPNFCLVASVPPPSPGTQSSQGREGGSHPPAPPHPSRVPPSPPPAREIQVPPQGIETGLKETPEGSRFVLPLVSDPGQEKISFYLVVFSFSHPFSASFPAILYHLHLMTERRQRRTPLPSAVSQSPPPTRSPLEPQ
ncbi:hypothetical protein GDO78_014623 [Eleutherodactylus coqui]|uniref:Uncharacterized protein n=1 Tax=Eleutherodactylus coqui TaxID=57060 RepID=A0A8J6C3T8_ELECQ|nr:hypothetical protein GDO78_014623 [Eleutherodactylus coqui]